MFAVPAMNDLGMSGTYTSFVMNMYWIDIKKLFVAVRPVRDADPESPATDVTIRSPLAYSRKLNYYVGLGFGTGLGLAGGIGGVFAGLGLFGGAVAAGSLLAPVGVAAVGVAGLVGGRSLSDWGYRALYRVAMGKGRDAFNDLLQSLALHSQDGGAFAPSS